MNLPDNEWTPPASEVARAIQYPMDERWPDRVINAYARDAMKARRKELEAER